MNKTKQIAALAVVILELVILALIVLQFTTVRVSMLDDDTLVQSCRLYAGHTVAMLRYADGTQGMAFTAGTRVCWFNW